MPTQITVTGHADTRIAPELGAVTLSIGGSGPRREVVLRETEGAHHDVLAGVRALDADGVLERWSAGQLRVWSHRPWSGEGRQLPLVHDARAEVEVVFRDLERLGEWLGLTGAHDLVTIAGIEWRITDATRRRVLEDTQRRAVADAVTKARVYAEALGLGEPVAVEVADRGLLGTQPSAGAGAGAPQATMMRAAAFGSAPPGPGTEFAPADLVIEASVDARFAAESA